MERADSARNRDAANWTAEYRHLVAQTELAEGQIHATLAVAQALDALAEILETKTISVSGWIGDRNAI